MSAGAATLDVVAEAGGRIVGRAFLKQLAPARCDHVGVLSVGVHPDHQRKGVGRALMKHLIEHARTCDLERLELCVRSDNAPAQALYASLGFVHEATRARFIKLADGTYVDDFIFVRFL
jgi:putative acetyltransferase